MKNLKIAISVIFFIAITNLGIQNISASRANQIFKKDYAELNHFKYGLFSVDAWKEKLSVIISQEIDKLYLIRDNKPVLKKHLENQLGILIDKVYERIEKKNKKNPIKLMIMDAVIDLKEIKKGIPSYAEAILAEMSSYKTESQLKRILKARIRHYVKTTFDTRPKSPKVRIVEKEGFASEEIAKDKLLKIIKRNHHVILNYAIIMISLALIIFMMEAFTKGPLIPIQYLVLTLTLLVMMIVGVTTPMIDMEAQISNLSFVLFDHPITFENQIIYFQSKSILDVFKIMIHHKKLEMKFVGVLLISFSVFFPLIKMFTSLAYYYNFRHVRKSRLIQFFVLRSAKWSMADVLVVAIFMAYIGFNGIINNQLSKLGKDAPNLELITTNGTSLQPGYYVFIGYTLLAMFLSSFVNNRPYKR